MVMKTRMLPKQITSTTKGAVHTVPSRQYLPHTEPDSLPGSDCCLDHFGPAHSAGEFPGRYL